MTKENFEKLNKREQANLIRGLADGACYTLELPASSLPEVKLETGGIYSEQDAIKAYATIRAFCQCNENVLPAIKEIVASETSRYEIGIAFNGTRLPKDKVLVMFAPIETELEGIQQIFFHKDGMSDVKLICDEQTRFVAKNFARRYFVKWPETE